MGAGSWFKKVKGSSTSVKSSGFRWKKKSRKDASTFTKSATGGEHGVLGMPPVEDVAATRIQTAFRAYLARKSLQRLKGTARLQTVIQKYPVRKQAKTALFYLHTWSKTQAEIRARRLCMVTEGRRKQKKLENQLKLEAKLHDLEVEWSGGSETMEETLSRIHQREEAAVKRERTMAYAFSHQWRANSNPFGHSSYELGKADWGWSWKERWIAARPWESRVPSQSVTPKKAQQPKQASKVGKNVNSATPKSTVSVKSSGSSGKPTPKARRKSFPPAEQTNSQSNGSSAGKPTSKAQGSSSPLAEQTNPYKQSNGSSSGKPTPKAPRSSFPPAEQTNSDKQSNGRDEQTNPDKQSNGSSSGKPTPKVRRSSFPPAEQRNSNKQSNRRVNPTARRLSFPIAQKKPVSRQESAKPKDESATKEKPVT